MRVSRCSYNRYTQRASLSTPPNGLLFVIYKFGKVGKQNICVQLSRYIVWCCLILFSYVYVVTKKLRPAKPKQQPPQQQQHQQPLTTHQTLHQQLHNHCGLFRHHLSHTHTQHKIGFPNSRAITRLHQRGGAALITTCFIGVRHTQHHHILTHKQKKNK